MSTMFNVHAAINEDQLIRLGQEGDPQALDTLFGRYTRALYKAALRLLGNPQDAEDALQDGLLSAYRNLPRFEGRSKFSTWLTRIVINAALMRRRSQRARPAVSIDDVPHEDGLPLSERVADENPGPEQLYRGKELHALVEQDLAGLSPALRLAFVLREVEGLSTAEAARTLGVSPNTLKARLWRARRYLTEALSRRLRGNGTKPEAGGSLLGPPLCGCEGQ